MAVGIDLIERHIIPHLANEDDEHGEGYDQPHRPDCQVQLVAGDYPIHYEYFIGMDAGMDCNSCTKIVNILIKRIKHIYGDCKESVNLYSFVKQLYTVPKNIFLLTFRRVLRPMHRTWFMTQKEFAHLSTRIRGKLVALARKFSRAAGAGDEAEDIAQEALLTLWELAGKGYPVRDAEALAVRLTKNICVNHFRKRKVFFQPLEEGCRAGCAPATERLEEEDIERIRKQLYGKLSETQCTFLTLRNEHCLSLDEIAAFTGRPKNSIKVAISTARRQMLEELKKIQ